MARYQLSQSSLAAELGVSQTQVSKRLRGHVTFDLDELDIVARFLGTTVVELLGGVTPPNGGGSGGADTRQYRSPLALVSRTASLFPRLQTAA